MTTIAVGFLHSTREVTHELVHDWLRRRRPALFHWLTVTPLGPWRLEWVEEWDEAPWQNFHLVSIVYHHDSAAMLHHLRWSDEW